MIKSTTTTNEAARSEIVFGSWNIGGRGPGYFTRHLALMADHGCSIVALQEVTERYYSALVRDPRVKYSVHSLDLVATGTDGSRRGTAIIVLNAADRILSKGLIDTPVGPGKALIAKVLVGREVVSIGSLHTPNGSKYGNQKALWQHEVATWYSRQTGPALFGLDANTPKQEGIDDENPAKWWREDSHPAIGNAARRLVGSKPVHGLRDVWKAIHQETLPYPVSFNRDNRREKRLEYTCRYDFIFASEHFNPITCDYVYDEVVAGPRALSDHALVTAQLELVSNAARPLQSPELAMNGAGVSEGMKRVG